LKKDKRSDKDKRVMASKPVLRKTDTGKLARGRKDMQKGSTKKKKTSHERHKPTDVDKKPRYPNEDGGGIGDSLWRKKKASTRGGYQPRRRKRTRTSAKKRGPSSLES